MKRLHLAGVLLGVFFLSGTLFPGQSNSNVYCQGLSCTVSATLTLNAIILACFLGIGAYLLPRAMVTPWHEQAANGWRRIGALLVNVYVVLFVFGPVLVTLILLTEWAHTGTFQQSFDREYWRATDWLIALPGGVFALFGLVFFYYRHALTTGRPNIGQFLLGYQAVGTRQRFEDVSNSRRFWFALLAVLIWPATLLVLAIHGRDAFKCILKPETRAVRFHYADANSSA